MQSLSHWTTGSPPSPAFDIGTGFIWVFSTLSLHNSDLWLLLRRGQSLLREMDFVSLRILSIQARNHCLVPLSIAGNIREGSLLRDDSICLHFTDGKTEAHSHAICKKIIKAKIIVSILYIF